MPLLKTPIPSLALIFLLATPALADEGMWTPKQVPLIARELAARGLEFDPQMLTDMTGHPLGAIVQISLDGSCSGAFISPDGLLVTNHHCIDAGLAYNSTRERDLLANGFVARTRAEELLALPDARIYVTQSIEDVTSTVLAPFGSNASDADRGRLIDERRRLLVDECEKPGAVRCRVSSFFEGTEFLRITQLEIRDVRLVYAPPMSVGAFGGEIDNWMWPRHTGDFGLVRAYVGRDGKPADPSKDNLPYRPAHHLRVSKRDLDPGDLTLVIGYPAATARHQTAVETAAAEEYTLPAAIRYRKLLLEVLNAAGAKEREIAIRNATRIRSLDNYLKKYEGTLAAFKRSGVVAKRREEESRIVEALRSRPRELRRYRDAMDEIRQIIAAQRKTRERDTILSWLYSASPMLEQATRLYRLSVARSLPEADRESGYQERDWPRLEAGLARAQRSIEPRSDRAGLRIFILEAAKLPKEQRIAAVDQALKRTGRTTLDEQVEVFLDRLYGTTRISEESARARMFVDSREALLARRDAMIEFAASLRETANEHSMNVRNAAGALARLRPIYMEALRTIRGGRLYPDGNNTLRIGFGDVEGYSPRDAVVYEPQTDARGLLEKDTGQEPFNSPPRLLELARAKKFGPYVDRELRDLPVNFLTSNDTTNGSSGSATLNAWGELAGLAFDGNSESMASDYLVEPGITRSIHVDTRYMLWMIDAVDGADHLVREIGFEPQL